MEVVEALLHVLFATNSPSQLELEKPLSSSFLAEHLGALLDQGEGPADMNLTLWLCSFPPLSYLSKLRPKDACVRATLLSYL